MKRRRLSRLQRTKIFDDAGALCCICGARINAERGERWIVEHVVPLWANGADDETNMRPAHEKCAIAKTVAEAPVKAKSDRIRAKHLGIKKPRTMRRWRKFNGQIVVAERER
jgi:5-methylcytosine-specific restriction enzyme A